MWQAKNFYRQHIISTNFEENRCMTCEETATKSRIPKSSLLHVLNEMLEKRKGTA
jgi:hypothetical protein